MLEIGLRRWPNNPEPSDEHEIVGVHVSLPPNDDDDDPRFAIDFVTVTGRTLRVRLPADQLEAIGRVLLDMAGERR